MARKTATLYNVDLGMVTHDHKHRAPNMQPSRKPSQGPGSTPPDNPANPHGDTEDSGAKQQEQLTGSARQRRFMFVPASGRAERDQDEKTRRTMRAHVMHNYLDKKEPGKATASRPVPTGGEKMRFRLTSDGLERKYPYRYGKARGVLDPQEAATSDASISPQADSMITDHEPNEEDPTLQALALFSGTSLAYAPTGREVQDEDLFNTSPLLNLGIGQIDPVGALPLELEAVDDALLDRFQYYERWPWCPVSGQNLWAPFAISDKLVFHATMYSWAMQFRSHFLGDAHQEAAIAKHKAAAITIINARISQPEYATRDETLVAVSVITNIELWFGDPDDALKHMNGLHALVSLRGGIHTLTDGVQRLLQRLICWNDLTISQLYGTPMRYPSTEMWDEPWRLQNQPSLPGWPTGLAVGHLRAAGIIPHEIVSALHTIRQVCHMEAVSPSSIVTESEQMERMAAISYIQRRLHIMVQTAEVSLADGWNPHMWRAVILASTIYVDHWLRGSQLTYPSYQIWIQKLYEAILQLSPSLQEMEFAPSMMLWVRVVGAVASKDQPLQEWFLEGLAETCVRWASDWNTFRAMLMDFLWLGDRDEVRYTELWQQVVERMARGYAA